MIKKLMDGEFSLKETFWKFGILGILVLSAAVRFFEYMLDKRIKNVGLTNYYMHYFSPIHPDAMAILWTLCYLSTMYLFLYYSVAEIMGIWRTSAGFERSALLKHLIRIFMLVFVLANLIAVF